MKLTAPHDCYLPAFGEVAKGDVVDVPEESALSLRDQGWKASKAKAAPADPPKATKADTKGDA